MPTSLSDFEVLCTIGSGSYGTCKKVRRKSDGRVFVWKEMEYGSMSETEKQMLVSEVNLLREFSHDNIVRYHERVVDKKRQILYLIMEYCEGGDLGAVIKRYSRDGRYFEEDMIWKTLAQCASALNECHKRKDGKSILHRDLKPANIFLDRKNNVKLGDFGLARVLHETSFAKTFVGTPYYMSPEQMNKVSYNEKSDIWSLGCVLYEMCALRPPFLAMNQRELGLKIRMGQFSPLPSRYSSHLSSLLHKMLNVECNARPSIESLLALPEVSHHVAGPPLKSKLELDIKREADLAERESKYKERESILQAKEAALKEREMTLNILQRELEKREVEVGAREMNVAIRDQGRCKKRNGLQSRDANIENLKASEDDHGAPLTPILNRAKRPLDSPSKHVSFKVADEKENDALSIQSAMAALRENEAHLFAVRERERNNTEYQRRKELRERLEKAKQRATQLRAVGTDNKTRANNLLNIR